MHPITAMIIAYLVGIIGAFVVFFAALMHNTAVVWIAVVVVVAALILDLVFDRCPHCKTHLSLRLADIFRAKELFCPYCGQKLED